MRGGCFYMVIDFDQFVNRVEDIWCLNITWTAQHYLYIFYRYSITKFGMVFGIAFAEWDLRFKSDFDFWWTWRTLVLSHSAFGIRRSIHRWICNFIFVDWTLVDGSHDLNTHAVGCSHNRLFFRHSKNSNIRMFVEATKNSRSTSNHDHEQSYGFIVGTEQRYLELAGRCLFFADCYQLPSCPD